MEKLVGKVKLRNPHLVYSDSDGNFKAVNQDPHGAEHVQPVTAAVVKYVHQKFQGNTVTVADARELLEHAPKRLNLPYSYGHKLQFYAQDVLIVLVANKQATKKKSGQKYEYTIVLTPKLTRKKSRSGRP